MSFESASRIVLPQHQEDLRLIFKDPDAHVGYVHSMLYIYVKDAHLRAGLAEQHGCCGIAALFNVEWSRYFPEPIQNNKYFYLDLMYTIREQMALTTKYTTALATLTFSQEEEMILLYARGYTKLHEFQSIRTASNIAIFQKHLPSAPIELTQKTKDFLDAAKALKPVSEDALQQTKEAIAKTIVELTKTRHI